MQTFSRYRFLDVIVVFLVAILITSNIASSAKIVDLGITLFGFGGIPPVRLAFDGGTLLFPFAYILGDVLTEVYGFKQTRRAIWLGFAALAFTALLFFVLKHLPGEAHWEERAGSAAYNAILGGISSGGIVLASLSGFLAGKFSNAIILSRMKVIMKGRAFWARAIASSVVGEFLDTFVFVFVATLTGVFMWELFAALVITNYLFKLSIEVLAVPFTSIAVRKLKKAEGIDTFDEDVRFNPFSR